jgi:PAS domain S-box-containing protein
MISVLYVDDEPSLLEIGKHFLERNRQFSVDIITSAPAAFALMKTKSYDAIISDYQMPGMNGIEFLKRVRTSGKTIPFILFTGRGREEIIIQALNEGADFYLQKGGEPVSQFTELAHKIRQAVQQRRAEASIRDHERHEAEILNFLPDATFAIDKTGTVIAWNHAMEKMTGIKASEILGKGNYEYSFLLYHERRPILIDLILAPDDRFEKDRYLYAIRDSTQLTAESTFEKPDGTHVPIWGKAGPLFNKDGNITGAIESIRDITERKQAETELRAAHEQLTAVEEELRSQYNELVRSERLIRESEEKFRSLVEYGLEAILILDLQGKILFANNAALRMTETGNEAGFIGRNVMEFIAPESREDIIRDFIQVSEGHDAYLAQYNVISAQGKRICVESIGKIIKYEGKPADLISLRDVTERKRVEDELRAAYEQISAQEEELRGQYDEMLALQERTS